MLAKQAKVAKLKKASKLRLSNHLSALINNQRIALSDDVLRHLLKLLATDPSIVAKMFPNLLAFIMQRMRIKHLSIQFPMRPEMRKQRWKKCFGKLPIVSRRRVDDRDNNLVELRFWIRGDSNFIAGRVWLDRLLCPIRTELLFGCIDDNSFRNNFTRSLMSRVHSDCKSAQLRLLSSGISEDENHLFDLENAHNGAPLTLSDAQHLWYGKVRY